MTASLDRYQEAARKFAESGACECGHASSSHQGGDVCTICPCRAWRRIMERRILPSSTERTPQKGWRNRITGHGEEAPDQLLANPRNWRVHPKAQQDALEAVLDQVGWVQDVIVNQRTGHVVDGHARIALAISRQEPSTPVVYVDLDEAEELLVLATLDPLSAMAVADQDALDALLAEVSADGALGDMLAGLAGEPAVKSGLTDPDDVPEEPAEPYVQRGEVYRLGEHRLMCGDSTDAGDVARLMDGERAIAVITDPPYLVDYSGGHHPQSLSNSAQVKDKTWDDYHEQASAAGFYEAFIRTAIAQAAAPDAAWYQWYASLRAPEVHDAWSACGLLTHVVIVWVKARAVLTHSRYMWQHELCVYGWVKGSQPAIRPPANAKTVWNFDQKVEQQVDHPTQKPVGLISEAMEHSTNTGDLCYEPFSGSGTTLIAAEKLGRRAYAMEIEPRYVQVAIERWENYTGQKAERIT